MHRAEPNVPHAAETMRAGSAARIVAGERIRPDFSPEAIGRVARQSLLHLLHPTSAAKWRRIDSHDRLSTLGPPVPIPGEWCDADYFEHGLMSNWTNGYTWKAFAGLFRDTAEFLTAMFPEAESFLDAGCAKGFLVRSLRKRGKQTWGFDHSAWAIEHAEESARPFVHLAGVDDVELDREPNVLLCFFLLKSLTEEQAFAFLERARARTRQALFAVIGTRKEGPSHGRIAGEDQDISHITLRSRGGVTRSCCAPAGDRTRYTGYRIAVQRFQKHPLPVRMAWELFIFSPS